MERRKCLTSAAAWALASTGLMDSVAAQGKYPSRPIQWVVPYPPGAFTDSTARMIGQRLTQRLGQPVVIENKSGAGSNIGTAAVVNAAPDGHTILYVSTANAINPSLYKRLPFNFRRDVVPVAGLCLMPQVVVVHPRLPVTSIPEFIAYAKAHPGRVNMASAGIGTGNHLAGEIFQGMTGTKFTHVPYRGTAPAMADLISGQVDVIFDNIATSLEQIRGGKIRALGVTTRSRLELLPHVLPVAHTVPGYEAVSFYGVGAPKGTPKEIVAVLNSEINAALAEPTIRQRMIDLGTILAPGTPADFSRLLDTETAKWTKAVKAAGIEGTVE